MRNIYPKTATLKIRSLTPVFSAILISEGIRRHFCPSETYNLFLWQFYWSWGRKALVNARTTPLTSLWILKSVASHWADICQLVQSQVHSGILSVCWGLTSAWGPPLWPTEYIWLSLQLSRKEWEPCVRKIKPAEWPAWGWVRKCCREWLLNSVS